VRGRGPAQVLGGARHPRQRVRRQAVRPHCAGGLLLPMRVCASPDVWSARTHNNTCKGYMAPFFLSHFFSPSANTRAHHTRT
jgi:hypothetical protein